MDERVLKYLTDILDTINEINEETDLRDRRFEVLCTDRVYRKFIERDIAIIGEAVNQILRIAPNIQITAARKIVNTRNLVIHSYDSVDNEILWAIVIKHIPILKTEIEQILAPEQNFLMKNIAIFASGSGSNAENLIEFFKDGSRGAKVNLVICNKQNAGVVERAQRLGVDCIVLTKEQIQDPETLLPILSAHNIDLIVLAGFLLLIPQYLIEQYENRIVNIHPALLPKFGGKGMYGRFVHEAVIAAGERETGITIHYVNGHYDCGNIIFQAKVSLSPNDSANDVEAKVRQLEQDHFAQLIYDTFIKP